MQLQIRVYDFDSGRALVILHVEVPEGTRPVLSANEPLAILRTLREALESLEAKAEQSITELTDGGFALGEDD